MFLPGTTESDEKRKTIQAVSIDKGLLKTPAAMYCSPVIKKKADSNESAFLIAIGFISVSG